MKGVGMSPDYMSQRGWEDDYPSSRRKSQAQLEREWDERRIEAELEPAVVRLIAAPLTVLTTPSSDEEQTELDKEQRDGSQ